MTVSHSKLANGLRVVTHNMPHLETVSLGIWVGSGARSEQTAEHGISHLLEHMAFKGTKRRSAREIAEEIESAGGDLNAATSLENTAYYARVLKNDMPLALDILSDILQFPVFADDELAREQEVILQEIAACQDSPDDIVFDMAQEIAFPDQPLGRSILGTPESVRHLQSRHLRDHLKNHYAADGMVLSAAGAIDHDTFVREAERRIGDLGGKSLQTLQPARYKGGATQSAKPFEQTHLLIGFEGFSYRSDEFYTSQVFSSLFGGGMSSRLFQEVRERHGLCYSIYSFSWGFTDTGFFGVHAATSPSQMAALSEIIVNELRRIAETAPAEAELARAKAQLKAGLLMSLESSGARAEQLARQLLAFNRPLGIDELIERVDRVSANDIRVLAEHLITSSSPTLSCAGDRGNLPSYDKLQKFIGLGAAG